MSKYIVSKSPIVRMDVMVKKEYHAQLVGYIQQANCRYESETDCNPGNGEDWVCLKNVEGVENGHNLGILIAMFYTLGDAAEAANDKFYIILNVKKKGKKKHVHENRTEAHEGSKSGDRGETSDTAEPGPDDGSCGDRADTGDPGPDGTGEPQ